MIRAACHCTDVRLEIERSPDWVNDCNCTLCRRYGPLWAYYEPGEVKLVQGVGATDDYRWDDKMLAFHRCKTCGCIAHFKSLADAPFICAVNGRMMPTLDPASVRIQHKDNGHTEFFWTRSDGPIVASKHPKMDPPGPEDWR
ncbi:MAG: hypothetical protein VB948_17635 [Pseudomonadales bacterium]|jgi:hypothetical protein